MHGFGGGLGLGMGFGWIFWLIIIGVAIWAVVRLTNNQTNQHTILSGSAGSQETPLDILKKRYVRGGITKEEFEEMKKDL